ncbi:helix-turn-helix domain-containing protein [Paenibacillus thiaminolyticus]|uniref:PucR family transcriptional regulator n=1 Tax=Paenibacillus thiaminolyticus TaxID=49283 RepID=UPI00232D444E|nr:helix-turn-helix domain-containing protein [Paenibacillus thiaminolyticus]WCF08514.1 helix-turn-helix domain-containing protein [Paenibacillus thiaminolyticus]
MDKQALQQQIEHILDASLEKLSVPSATWREWTGGEALADGQPAVLAKQGNAWYMLWKPGTAATEVLKLEGRELAGQEEQWLQLILRMGHCSKSSLAAAHITDEQQAHLFGQWVADRVKEGEPNAEVPDSFSWKSKLFIQVVPFLLVAEHAHREAPAYQELYKLLRSYFGGEVNLIPLSDKEWLILCPEQLTQAGSGEDESEERETMEELLTSYCLGLYELLSSEWVGESHLTIGYPFTPVKGIPGVVSQLRETLYLGRAFHVTDTIHLPWELHLERLVNSIPDEVRKQFLQRVVTKAESFADSETMATLQHFFQFDCSVSETAKRMYIHRNTLLYRLDKIKQETGLDVRKFSDAVLVKLILLLYKVTK